jgi:hypothetical protein
MSEPRQPLWVSCKECSHKWIALYLPMDLDALITIMKNMHCPMCAGESSQIFMIEPSRA